MKRGDVFTAATGSGFGGKPRPVVIIQADMFIEAPTVLVALVTDVEHAFEPLRPIVEPDEHNGLRKASALTADTLVAVRQRQFGRRLGSLSTADMRRLDDALLRILALP